MNFYVNLENGNEKLQPTYTNRRTSRNKTEMVNIQKNQNWKNVITMFQEL
jgi:hypothetical protein